MPYPSQESLANVIVKIYIIMTEFLNPLAVKVHPIALLSIVDHHERAVGQRTSKRVLGIVLGEIVNGVYEITNSYAIPFDEN